MPSVPKSQTHSLLFSLFFLLAPSELQHSILADFQRGLLSPHMHSSCMYFYLGILLFSSGPYTPACYQECLWHLFCSVVSYFLGFCNFSQILLWHLHQNQFCNWLFCLPSQCQLSMVEWVHPHFEQSPRTLLTLHLHKMLLPHCLGVADYSEMVNLFALSTFSFFGRTVFSLIMSFVASCAFLPVTPFIYIALSFSVYQY